MPKNILIDTIAEEIAVILRTGKISQKTIDRLIGAALVSADDFTASLVDPAAAEPSCLIESTMSADGSCSMSCTLLNDHIPTDELCRDFTPHAGALADEFGRMAAFADLFAAGYEAEAVSPEHEAAFRTWVLDVSPAAAKFTADLAHTNRRLALAL